METYTTQAHHSRTHIKTDTEKLIAHDDDIIRIADELLFSPFNPLNKEIRLNDVQSILSTYGLPPNVFNLELYKRAFIHRSYIKRPFLENQQMKITVVEQPSNCMSLKTKSNERLEFLGDGILECITKYYLYRRFPKENEGFMTEKKIALVKNEAIGKLAYDMGLHKWLIISKHAEEKKIRTNLKKLGCLFEAFLGALFLDFNKIIIKDDDKWFENIFVTGPGFQMAQKFVESIFEKHIDWVELINTDNNYKNILQVKIQKEFKTTPYYLEIGHDLEIGYTMGVYLCIGQQIYDQNTSSAIKLSNTLTFNEINDILKEEHKIFVFLGSGVHKIKKKAEQFACENALSQL
jgi:dsRNA-specific ribonuclease